MTNEMAQQESAGVLSVGVARESAAGERRVALTPDGVTRLLGLGLRVLVQTGAGEQAWFPDASYAAAGATLVDAPMLYSRSDLVDCVQAPAPADLVRLRPGQTLVGVLQPRVDAALVRRLAEGHITAISLDGLPRTLSSAQSMDALTSQSNVAGYKAVLVAASAYGSYFPMLMTAAGTVRPAKVLVLGAGVAGLQAIGTARRLGAVVTAYDVRDAARADVASTGAAFLHLRVAVPPQAGGDGYARQLTPDEQARQSSAMAEAIGAFDVVIATAQVPGRRPPVLVTHAAVSALSSGSVVVDLASSPLGGNVEGSEPDTTIVTDNGVTIIGAGNLAASVPRAASTAYSRNVAALLAHLLRNGHLVLDTTDAITAGVLVQTDGQAPGATPGRGKTSSTVIEPQLSATG